MVELFNRWSQIVRKPGAVRIVGWSEISVPPIGAELPYQDSRPGIRLLVQPLEGADLPWTIDVTSTNAIAMLDGFLRTGNHVGMKLSWRSAGFGSLRKDTIILEPMMGGA